MQNFGYMLAAFSAIWIGLFAYVFSLQQRQSRINRDIDQLKTTVQAKQTKG